MKFPLLLFYYSQEQSQVKSHNINTRLCTLRGLLTTRSSDLSSVEDIYKPLTHFALYKGHLGLFSDSKCKGLGLWYPSLPRHRGSHCKICWSTVLTRIYASTWSIALSGGSRRTWWNMPFISPLTAISFWRHPTWTPSKVASMCRSRETMLF